MYNIGRGDIMSNSILRDKAKNFAKNIIFLCRNMKAEHKETVLINQLLRSGTSLEQIFTRLNMHKVRRILYPNSKLRKKNAMRLNIGLNFYLKLVVLKKLCINQFKMIAVLYAEC